MKRSMELRHEENFDTLPRALSSPAAHADGDGEVTGRLSGGSRASTALQKVPTVKVIVLAAPRKGTYLPSPLRLRSSPGEPYASPSLAVAAAAASSAADSTIASFGYSPTTVGIMRGVATAVARAAAAAGRSLKRPVTTVEPEAAAAAAPRDADGDADGGDADARTAATRTAATRKASSDDLFGHLH